MKKIYTDFAKYNLWANQKMVKLFSNLSDGLIEKPISSSYPSVRLTFLHIWDAEQVWLRRLEGDPINYFPSRDYKGSNQQMFEDLVNYSKSFLDFIEKQEEAFFESPVTYQFFAGQEVSQPVREILHHVFNHSTYHRGQLTMMARQLDIKEIEGIDYIVYLRER